MYLLVLWVKWYGLFIIFNRFNKCRGRLRRDRIWLVWVRIPIIYQIGRTKSKSGSGRRKVRILIDMLRKIIWKDRVVVILISENGRAECNLWIKYSIPSSMTNPIYSRVLFYLNARLRLNYNHLKSRERGGMISTKKSIELLRKDWLGKNLRYSRVKFNCWRRIYSGESWSINPSIFLDLLWSRGRAGRLCTMLFISDHTSSRSK